MKGELLALLLLVPMFVGCLSFHRGPMPGEPTDAKFVEVEGARVRYTDTGGDDKPTVVLVHGFASALDAWAPVVPALAKTHRVIALDLKGFGWTDRPEGDYSPEAQARLVLKLMDQRGVAKAAIVAHSWGSSIALAAAMRAPDRVTKLALYDAWVYEEQLPTFFHWARADGVGEALFGLWYKERADERIALAFYDRKFVTERLVEDVDAALDRPGTTAAALAAVRGQRYEDVEAKYRKIDKPTLLLWGRDDVVTPLRYGERLVKDLPNATLVTYAQCGHFPMIEAQNASNRDLVAFLTKETQP
ncbi:MAG TPA: alpha/beta fold hydrolase [Labilithrix sp.]